MRRRLTFEGVDILLRDLETNLYNNLFIPGYRTELKKDDILVPLQQIKAIIINQHNGLFLHLVNNLIYKVELFGLHFVSLDIRQESSVHATLLQNLADDSTDTLATIAIIKKIRQYALARIRETDDQSDESPVKKIWEKLAMRCSFGIINAGRNSAQSRISKFPLAFFELFSPKFLDEKSSPAS